MWENVRDVLFQRTDSSGVKRPPEIDALESDMLEQGCQFSYYLTDTSKYLLPQRRTRVYGIVSESEQRPEKMKEDYATAMLLFESFARCDVLKKNVDTYIHM